MQYAGANISEKPIYMFPLYLFGIGHWKSHFNDLVGFERQMYLLVCSFLVSQKLLLNLLTEKQIAKLY